MSEVAHLSNFLKSKGLNIPVENVWLKSCVSCYKSMTPSYSQSDLNQFVFTQWRLADLRSVGAASLPPDCAHKEFLILNGKYAVQFNYGINVAVPFHKQLLKIRKPESQFNLDLDATKEKSQTKEVRSLKIEITDGLTTIVGFEDKHISCIDVVLPGEKALLIGPLEIRKGCLMLNEKNISLLGGEVDTLFVPNAVENILARALNLPQNPNPIDSSSAENSQAQLPLDDDDDLFMAAAIIESQNTQKMSTQTKNSFQSQNSAQNTSQNRNANTQKPLNPQNKNANIQKTFLPQNPNPIDSSSAENSQAQLPLDDDDDLFMAAAIIESQNTQKMSTQTKNSFQSQNSAQNTSQNRNANTQKPLNPQNKNANIQKTLNSQNRNANTQKTLNSFFSPKPNSGNVQTQPDRTVPVEKELVEMLDDDFDFPMEEILVKTQPNQALDPLVLKREMEKTFSNDNWNRQRAAEAPPPSHENDKIIIEYLGSPLSQFAESEPATQKTKITSSNPIIEEPFPPKTYPSERKLKGRVVKLTQKLGLKDEEWKLSAIVAVKGMEIDMDFSPQVLDKIIGINGKELTSKKKEVVRNPEIKSQMNKILIDGQHKIKSLNCYMLIKFNNFIANPVISDVFEDT